MRIANLKKVLCASVGEDEITLEIGQEPGQTVKVRETTFGELRVYLVKGNRAVALVVFAENGIRIRRFSDGQEFYFNGQEWCPCQRESLFPGGKIEPEEGEICDGGGKIGFKLGPYYHI